MFELNGLGSPRSAADKKIKTIIIQKIFGTTSKTEIEKMKPSELNYKGQESNELFEVLKAEEDSIEFLENYSGQKDIAI